LTYGVVRAWQGRREPATVAECDGDDGSTGRGRQTPRPIRPPRPALAIFLSITALVLAIGAGIPTGVRAATTAEIDTDALNLRDAPSTLGDVLAVMGWGESVEVLDGPTADGWYEVSYGDETGWALGDYLSFDGVGGGSDERWIDVDRSTQEVTLYDGNDPIASYWAAMGYDQSDDGYYATAIGTYYVYAKHAELAWTEYGQAYISDWVAFDPDRNNGFHSWSMDADGNVLPWGDGATGGCVALEPSAADTLYDFAEIGMRVEVHW
jgi:L,D-transpeptidase-like protein/SH3 domain-containing protein